MDRKITVIGILMASADGRRREGGIEAGAEGQKEKTIPEESRDKVAFLWPPSASLPKCLSPSSGSQYVDPCPMGMRDLSRTLESHATSDNDVDGGVVEARLADKAVGQSTFHSFPP